MPKPLAVWNPARDAWEVETMGLFCEHSDVFSETWPTSGMTRAGTAYAQPTWEPHTDGSESSSLLPTPKVTDEQHGSQADAERHSPGLRAINYLLPTPSCSDATGGGSDPAERRSSGHHVKLVDWAKGPLLPTPRASDGTKGGPNQRGSSGDLMLPSAVMLLPTPTATPYGNNQSPSPGAAVRPSLDSLAQSLGASTRPLSPGGKPC